MRKAGWIGCAGGLLLSVGCEAADVFVFFKSDSLPPRAASAVEAIEAVDTLLLCLENVGQDAEKVTEAQVESLSNSLQKALKRQGLTATVVTTDGGGLVKINSQTKKGQKFTFVLRRDEKNAKTHVRIEWEEHNTAARS